MSDNNGFDEYKLYYDEKFRICEQQHTDVIAELREIRHELQEVKYTAQKHSAYWAAVWGGVLLSINLFAPLVLGGCNAG
jgi:hypothetical protein